MDSQYLRFTATSDGEKFEDDIWICDSGASSHYCVSDRGMFDVREINENIRVGNVNLIIAIKIGNLKFKVIQIDGSTFDIILHDVKFIPDLWVNLFSINQALKKGHKIEIPSESYNPLTEHKSKVLDRLDDQIIFA